LRRNTKPQRGERLSLISQRPFHIKIRVGVLQNSCPSVLKLVPKCFFFTCTNHGTNWMVG
jgi:hypothetical protein